MTPALTVAPTRAGLGDQIRRHEAVHRLATALGLPYRHTPIGDWRLFPGAGRFTGLDLHPDPAGEPEAELPLSAFLNATTGRAALPAAQAGARLIAVRHEAHLPPALLAAALGTGTSFPFAALYARALAARGREPGTEARAAAVLHLRLGDTVVVPLPDGRRIYMDGMREVVPGAPWVRPQAEPEAVAALLRRLRGRVPGRILVLSDGFARTARLLRGHAPRLGLRHREVVAALAALDAGLAPLRALEGVELRIGEAEADTRFAVDILANAGLVIASHGTFARMVARHLGGLEEGRVPDLFALLRRPELLEAALAPG